MRADIAFMCERVAAAALRGLKGRLRKENATLAELRVLATMLEVGPCGVSRLARLCAANQPTTSKLLKRLFGRGIVRRSPSQSDRRRIDIELTPVGAARAETLIAVAAEHERAAMDALPALADPALRAALRAFMESAA
jgi:DNA-binding MarR family transcriptional regulator